jgi:hypothetical protein
MSGRRKFCNAELFSMILSMVACGLSASPALAALVVNDQWRDTNRTEPTTTTTAGPYSENGVDADGDGDIESRWWRSGTSGTMNVNQPGGGAAINGSPNVLRTNTTTATSASWTTYFTPESTTVNLANQGDSMLVTWKFTPITVNSASTSGSGFRLAVVNSTSTGRVAADATPISDTYTGYAIFMNMNTTLGAADPFALLERTNPAVASAFLSAGGSWTQLDDEETSGVAGYTSGTEYTFTMSFAHNNSDGLDIAASMTGGSVGGDGSLNVTFTDTTPNGSSFAFDTFGLRPSTLEDSAAFFETSLFRVEFFAAPVPEVSSFLLLGLVGALTGGLHRLLRRHTS